jgi:streptogramin lyase
VSPIRLATLAAATFVAALPALAAPTVLPLPADWYPESLAAGPEGRLYVGSWRQGAIARVDPATAAVATLVPPGSNGLGNVQGVLVDAARGALWACSGNIGFTTVPVAASALKRFDLATGAPQASFPMPDAGYCNDLAQDARGNVYVTDSLHPRVLRIAPDGRALATWKEDPQLADRSVFGEFKALNGIAIDGDGVVVSVLAATAHLLRIPIAADGNAGAVARL